MLKLQAFPYSGWVRITSQNKTYLKKKNVSSKKEFLQQINMGVPNVNFFKCLSGWPLLAIQKFTFEGYNETLYTYLYLHNFFFLYISTYLDTACTCLFYIILHKYYKTKYVIDML